jgi:hypothetical protein
MKMRKKSVLVFVIEPVLLCSPSTYIVIVAVLVVVVVVLANVMFVCVCFLQCCCDSGMGYGCGNTAIRARIPRSTEAKNLQ